MGNWDFAFLAAVALRTAMVFVVLVIGVRKTGKRQTGEMNLHDLVLVLVLANAVQNAMTQGDARLSVALVSSGTLLVLGWIYELLVATRQTCQPWLAGVPTVIAERGHLLRGAMWQEGVTERELMAAVRDQGLMELAQVRLAVLEIDGSISVVPQEGLGGG